ncbi:DUF2332 domain-containing protein [Dietzia sp.]|uniref:DUF2332 domain-containing protein n=1 Tax=Dietzia sp. TaxID=1871616 RepID=UPI002FDB87E0
MDSAHVVDVSERYARFAEFEVRGRNPVYASWATGVAGDRRTADLIAQLPPLRRQPVLVFAVARFLGAAETTDYEQFAAFLNERWDDVETEALRRATQTNEAKRTACLLPFFSAAAAGAPEPGAISLIEAGASAGLCLYPDRYRFRFAVEDSATTLALDPPGAGPDAPVLECSVRGMIAPPRRVPEVRWRGGVDLNPLDPADADSRRWLEALVWPGQPERIDRLRAALDIAAAEPAHVLRGDLVERIADAVIEARRAAPEARPVVFHTAVLAYLDPDDRARFADTMAELSRSEGAVWISSEGVSILPEVADRLPAAIRKNKGMFAIAVNGHPLATTHGHGDWVRAIEP